MIIVDTNVLSQPIRPDGDLGVVRWIDTNFDQLYLPAVAVGELLFGAYKMRDKVQREAPLRLMESLLERFSGRVINYTEDAARLHGRISGEQKRVGITIGAADGMIASIALTLGAPVATRNVGDFAPTGVKIINPWTA